jgi:tRNA (guanine-N7-)-methyltransferase
MKFQRAKHRLVSPKFLSIYESILKPGGFIHLKSDSEFLHGYLHGIIKSCEFKVHESYHDIYNQLLDKPMHEALYLKTYYEKIWIKNKKPINYLKFSFK